MKLRALENLFMIFFIAIVIDFVTGVSVGAKEGKSFKFIERRCSNGQKI